MTSDSDTPESRLAEATAILRGGEATPQEMLKLAKRLKGDRRIGLARRLLGRARGLSCDDPKTVTRLRQQHALCTYKDRDLPADSRLTEALRSAETLVRAAMVGGSGA